MPILTLLSNLNMGGGGTPTPFAYDTVSNATPGTGNLSWSHSGGTDVNGVKIYVSYPDSVDAVTTVTYGGVAVPEAPGSPQLKATGELSAVHAFHLGDKSAIPDGTQTVVVNISGSSVEKIAVCYTTVGSDDTSVEDHVTWNSDSIQDPRGTLSHNGNVCFDSLGLKSGRSAVGDLDPLAGWTSSYEYDFGVGSLGTGAAYKYDTLGTADVTTGWDQFDDDAAGISLAIREGVGDVTGTGAAAAQRATASGAGTLVIEGSAAVQAERATASGMGTVAGAVMGSGAAQAQRATASGAGTLVVTGAGAAAAQRATAKGFDVVPDIWVKLPADNTQWTVLAEDGTLWIKVS